MLTVSVGAARQSLPVHLHVYDFALPAKLGFDGNWNASFQALGGSKSLSAVEALKDFFHEHRLVPSGVAWPAGLNYNGGITYDCASGTFSEEASDYDFSRLGPKYIDGSGWNGIGFPSFQIMQFVDNSTPRPASFCGVARGADLKGTAAYNSMLEGKVNGFPVLDSQPAAAHPARLTTSTSRPQREARRFSAARGRARMEESGLGSLPSRIGLRLERTLHRQVAPVSELQRSVIYNDYGRTDTFNWDLQNGRYEATVSIGWHGRTYPSQVVLVEWQKLFDRVATTPAEPYRVASLTSTSLTVISPWKWE